MTTTSDAMSSTKRKDRQATRSARSYQALLRAASELIVEGGLSEATFAAIGERAGYSRGMVTARFGSKDQLVEALLEQTVTRWSHRKVLSRADSVSGLQGVLLLIDAIREQFEVDARGLALLYTLMFEALGVDSGLRARFARLHVDMRNDLARMIARGIGDGSIRRDVDPINMSALIVAGLRGIAYQWRLERERFDPVPILKQLSVETRRSLAA